MDNKSVLRDYPLLERKGPSLEFQSRYLLVCAVDAITLGIACVPTHSGASSIGFIVLLGMGALNPILTLLAFVLAYFAWAARISSWRLLLAAGFAAVPGLILLQLIHGGRGLWP